MNQTGISQFNQSRIEWAIRLRYSPMPELSMDLVRRQLNEFRIGELRTVGKWWEFMMERDGELAINSEKRKADSATLDWQIASDGSPDGDKHAAALQYFYNNLTATKALDQDATGGVDELIFQVLSAVDYYYSAHEILLRVDNPAAQEVTAEFRHTPVWFFEARRGYLGYLKHIFDLYGQPCIAGEWLTAVNTGWMRPLSVAYGVKWLSFADWMQFSRRYGSGFLEGITEATKDSTEWNDALETLRTLANDAMVLHNKTLQFKFLEQPGKNQLPFQPLAELVDRLYAKCYRGVDLATGSRAGSGQGRGSGVGGGSNAVGASVQREESGILLVRDAKWVTGVFNDRIDRPIIRYLFNEEPRAWFALIPPLNDTTAEDLQTLRTLVPMGLRVALKEVYQRFRWSVPSPDEPCLSAGPMSNVQSPKSENGAPGSAGVPSTLRSNATEAGPASSDAEGKREAESGNEESPDARKSAGEEETLPAQTSDNTPIAAGADPARNPGLVAAVYDSRQIDQQRRSQSAATASRQMPDTQVDASDFWSRAGLAPRGADGQMLPMPSLGYAVPNASTTIEALKDRLNDLKARGLGHCRAAQALQAEINRRATLKIQPPTLDQTAVANANFNTDEPRDSHGRWTTQSDATASATKKSNQHITKLAIAVPASRPGAMMTNKPTQLITNLSDTLGNKTNGAGTNSLNKATTEAKVDALLDAMEAPKSEATLTPLSTLQGIGGLLDLAGQDAWNLLSAFTFQNIGDTEDALKQLGFSSDQLKKWGFENVEEDSGTTGEKPMEQGIQSLPPPQRALARAGQGVVESSPRLAIAAADPVLGAVSFGAKPEGFDAKQAALALALPFAAKYSSEITGVMAQKFGVNSVAALNALRAVSGMTTPAAALILQQEQEISKLPPDQQEEARINMWASIAVMTLLSAKGVKLESTPEAVPAEPNEPLSHLENSDHTFPMSYGAGDKETQAQIKTLQDWAKATGRLRNFEAAPGSTNLGEGEHDVFNNPKTGRVDKVTAPGTFGYMMTQHGLEPANPSFYLRRIDLMNQVFDSDIHVEGVTPGKNASIITSQPFRQADPDLTARGLSEHPSDTEVEGFMRANGFEHGPADGWVRKADGVMAFDVKPENFIKTEKGVVPVDLILQKGPLLP